MTDVLAKIIDGKRDEVAALRATTSLADLDAAAAAADPVRGFAATLADAFIGIRFGDFRRSGQVFDI